MDDFMLEWTTWRIYAIMDNFPKKNTYPVPCCKGIRVRLILFLIIFLAFSLIIFNLFSIHQLKSHFLKTGSEKNLDLAQKVAAAIEESMEEIIRDLFSISRIWPLEGESISDRHADLEGLKDRNENIRLLSISDIQGNKLLTVSRKDDLSVDKLIEKTQRDKIESFLNGTIFISNVHPVTQALPLVDISVPLRRGDQNQVKGFLSAVISLKGIYRKLEAIECKGGQELYLMDTNGLIVAYFSTADGQKTLGIKGLIPFWDNLWDIKDIKQQYISGISEGGGITPLIYKNLRGQDVLGVISVSPKLKWRVIVEESVNEVLEPITPILKKNIIISVLVFIFVSILAIFFTGYILAPLFTCKESEAVRKKCEESKGPVEEVQKRQNELEIKNLQLLKNSEDLENILSIVSHDLKNPIYIIQDFASILLQEYNESLSEDGLYYIERIKANAKNMERLILDLLELSRVSRSKGILQECSISDLIQRSLEEFRQVIRSKGIEVRISGPFPVCFCEPERILQVFMNLLSNSIKFMQDVGNPMVEIGYKETQEDHEFFVRDNGIGIEGEYHEKIFVIFQRLQDVRDVEGTGVGLTIVKKIVETHGGRVWVESEKGRGATFYFTIPKKISSSEVKEKVPKVSSA